MRGWDWVVPLFPCFLSVFFSMMVNLMSEKLSRKRISRRQFLSKGLWASLAGLFMGTIFGLPRQPGKAGPKTDNPSLRQTRYSKLAG
jgi:hypothetical protein